MRIYLRLVVCSENNGAHCTATFSNVSITGGDGGNVTVPAAPVEHWAQQQSEAAIAWANQFPTGPLRDTAMENIRAQIQRQQEASTETGTQQM